MRHGGEGSFIVLLVYIGHNQEVAWVCDPYIIYDSARNQGGLLLCLLLPTVRALPIPLSSYQQVISIR